MTLNFENGPISVELIPVAKGSRIGYTRDEGQADKDAQKADAAVNNALELVYRTAERMKATVKAMGDKDAPDVVEMDFAIKLDEDGTATVVHSGLASHFRVRLKWGEES